MSTRTDAAIKMWRAKVSTWLPTCKQVFSYIRNPVPAKIFALKTEDGRCVSGPAQMVDELDRVWDCFEKWPSECDKLAALHKVEDHYTLFVPRVFNDQQLKSEDLIAQVQATKNSAQGMDGWTVQEIKSLPFMAWTHLLEIWPRMLPAFHLTPLARFKRIPIEKGDLDVPMASQLRPIDIFSVIV